MSKRKTPPPRAFVYAPTPSAFVPRLRPGAIVSAADAQEAERLAAHPCFSPAPEADTTPEPTGSTLQED